ncbi:MULTISPECIES: FAD-binding protein [Proteus]|uniref:Electron transfer flavoprotein subunit alpha n=1 Tax=Proteus terrae subsp. cibarius TaxID=626774 RepID=A0ABX6JS50_9GAMM|nr:MULTISPECIES: FAD-binding protein [Proteus]QHP77796.1 electron transfer flavoprotein subunit alpha [Proteus vulgaris]MCM2368107.1 FAD-binding protein [Proteus sp. FZP2095]MCO4182703.1 FAD-binding protein [Proteus terrae]MCO4191212.1 FAD-binding protein [Proteus terrae]QGW04567.1 electron transfer flavoprotein subunit alpha [Proteus terrae subsp. cibarius]
MASLLPTTFVYAEKADDLAKLIAFARGLGEKVNVLFIGDDESTRECVNLGADCVYCFAPQEGVIAEDYAASFAAIIKEAGANALVLLASSKRAKAIAARLGVTLKAGVISDALSLAIENNTVIATHQVYGGLAHAKAEIRSPYAIATVGSALDVEAITDAPNAPVVQSAFIAPAHTLKVLARKPKQGSTVDLGKAHCVVGVGRGFAKADDIALASALAKALQGEVGCSRPIAEGEGWMEHDRYIGVSGVTLGADVYVAVGISGQIQHMVGVDRAKIIVGINKDKNAPIFNMVDYGIVGDLYKVLPALTAKLGG